MQRPVVRELKAGGVPKVKAERARLAGKVRGAEGWA